jgi:hypothetical protein
MEDPKKSKTQAAAQLGDSAPAVHVHLPEELVTEILLRLPGESVIRARDASKAWRRIATDPAFLADHARNLPLEILEYEEVRASTWFYPYGLIYDVTVVATPVSAAAADRPSDRRRLMRCGHHPHNSDRMYGHCDLKASCDGVLLFKVGNDACLICNPATRQWTELPRLRSGVEPGRLRVRLLPPPTVRRVPALVPLLLRNFESTPTRALRPVHR